MILEDRKIGSLPLDVKINKIIYLNELLTQFTNKILEFEETKSGSLKQKHLNKLME